MVNLVRHEKFVELVVIVERQSRLTQELIAVSKRLTQLLAEIECRISKLEAVHE